MTTPDPLRPEPGPDAGIDDIEADIETTRQQLGETVGALTEKLDVKKQAQQKVDRAKERVVDTAQSVRAKTPPAVPVAAVVAVVAIIGLVIWRRRRR